MAHIALNGTGSESGRTVVIFLPVDSLSLPPRDLSDKQCQCIVRTLGGGVYYVRNTLVEVLDRIKNPES